MDSLADGSVFELYCRDCFASVGFHSTEAEAADAWNSRTVDVGELATVADSLAAQEDRYCQAMARHIRKAVGL